jgi:hypothetical protein
MLWIAAALALGVVLGVVGAWAWLRRDVAGQNAWGDLRAMRRHDRVREAIVLARENLYGCDEDRALKWAKRAVRLDRCHPEAHAVLGACRHAVDHDGQAIRHLRRAEELVRGVGSDSVWRAQNAIDAVQVCMRLRSEATEQGAQILWDEAHAWAELAHRLNPEGAQQEIKLSPWLANFAGGEAWLQP